MNCFGKVFRQIFKFFYHIKPCEHREKAVEADLEMATDSSDMENVNIKTNSGSSQDQLVTSSGDSLSNQASRIFEKIENTQNLLKVDVESEKF